MIFLYNFKPRFVPLIEAGTKLQTIRPLRVDCRVPRVGDMAHLYVYLRTARTRLIAKREIVRVRSILIDLNEPVPIVLDGTPMRRHQLGDFVKADGFANPAEFTLFFRDQYGLTMQGHCIQWEPAS
jgi:hypothetical protein